MFDYDFINHKPRGRLVFYDRESDCNVQFFYKDRGIDGAVRLIKDRIHARGASTGKTIIQFELKQLLGLIK